MSKINWDMDIVKSALKTLGIEILNDEFIGSRVKYKFKCEHGHHFEKTLYSMMKYKKCPKCSKGFLTYEEIKKITIENGCELVSKEYINVKTPLEFKCKCGKHFIKPFAVFKISPRCRECYKKSITWNIIGVEKIKSEISKFGVELISENISVKKDIVKIKCKCGNIYEDKILNAERRGYECLECRKNKATQKYIMNKEEISNYFKQYGIEYISGTHDKLNYSIFKLKCKNCGELYEQKLNSFKNSEHKICNKCSKEIGDLKNKSNIYDFKEYVKNNSNCEFHSYDYFKNVDKSKVNLICECGEIYSTSISYFKKSRMKCCKKCIERKTTEFINKDEMIKYIHENFKDIEILDVYCNEKAKTIRHKYKFKLKSGNKIKTLSFSYIYRNGINMTNISKGEIEVEKYLMALGVKYESQYTFEDLKYKDRLRIDFYIPNFKLGIEVDGIYHVERVEAFSKTEEDFEIIKLKDSIKNKYFEDNNLRLIRLPYYKSDLKYINNMIDVYLKPIMEEYI